MSIKLTYFNARGVAELIRYIFAYAGQEFEDERIQRESWAERKPDAPLGSVPYVVLESGERYAQATSLARFFADKFDIRGKTAEEKLQSDMIVDLVRTDIIPLLVKIFFEKDNEKKAALKKEAQDKVNVWFEKVEALYMKGESSVLESGFSWADLALFNAVNDFFPNFNIIVDEKFEKIHKTISAVKSEPKIAEWIEKRPFSPM